MFRPTLHLQLAYTFKFFQFEMSQNVSKSEQFCILISGETVNCCSVKNSSGSLIALFQSTNTFWWSEAYTFQQQIMRFWPGLNLSKTLNYVIRMHACMHVCMYVCMYVWMNVCMCMYACMYVCMYECMYVCMYVSLWLSISTYVSIRLSVRASDNC